MEEKDAFEQQKEIFGWLFVLANKLQAIGDRELGEITTKQWFLMMMIEQWEGASPTLSDLAKEMGTSRQNLKQLALKLQEKGYLSIEKDREDSRILRLGLTDKCHSFWKTRQERDELFIRSLFAGLDASDITALWRGFRGMYANALKAELGIHED